MTVIGAVLVGCGSAVGALARYAIGQAIARVNNSDFPWGTWLINVSGTLLLGLFFYKFSATHHDPDLWLVLGTGFCGGFTTFSAMSVEAVELFKTRALLGFVYLGSSLVIGLIAAWATSWWLK